MRHTSFALLFAVAVSPLIVAETGKITNVDSVADYHRAWAKVEQLQAKLDALMKEFRSASTTTAARTKGLK